MALLGNTTVTRIDLPHEDGEWIDVRPLSWRELEQARRAQSKEFMESVSGLGVEIIKELFSGTKTVAEVADDGDDDKPDVPEQINKQLTLRYGIVAWSYNAKVNPDSIDRLDEETANYVYEQIRDMTIRTSKQGESSGVR